MYLDVYFKRIDTVMNNIRSTQLGAIKQAGAAVAESLAQKGAWFIMDTGHMIGSEAFMRAGGLAALRPFKYELRIDDKVVEDRPQSRTAEEAAEREAQIVRLALDQSRMREGDVLQIGSNSGRTANVIEVALQCRTRGITTIGLSSAAQMKGCEAAHVSGKKLGDVVDIFIDNCGFLGDAVVETKGNENMCPSSGIAAAYILWAIQAEAVGLLEAKGVKPTIYRSVHVGGMEHVTKMQQQYIEQGF